MIKVKNKIKNCKRLCIFVYPCTKQSTRKHKTKHEKALKKRQNAANSACSTKTIKNNQNKTNTKRKLTAINCYTFGLHIIAIRKHVFEDKINSGMLITVHINNIYHLLCTYNVQSPEFQ